MAASALLNRRRGEGMPQCGVTFWEMRARSATRLTIFCAWRGPDEPLFVECEVGLQERLYPPRQRPYPLL